VKFKSALHAQGAHGVDLPAGAEVGDDDITLTLPEGAYFAACCVCCV